MAAPLVLALTLALTTATASLADDDGDDVSVGQGFGSTCEIVFDVLVLRPLGAAATVGGLVAFVATSPMLLPSWEWRYGWDTFVIGPYEYTVERPLGEV